MIYSVLILITVKDLNSFEMVLNRCMHAILST